MTKMFATLMIGATLLGAAPLLSAPAFADVNITNSGDGNDFNVGRGGGEDVNIDNSGDDNVFNVKQRRNKRRGRG